MGLGQLIGMYSIQFVGIFFFYLLFWQTGTLNWDEINCACKWPIKSVYLEAAYPPVSAPFNNQVTFLFQIILH